MLTLLIQEYHLGRLFYIIPYFFTDLIMRHLKGMYLLLTLGANDSPTRISGQLSSLACSEKRR